MNPALPQQLIARLQSGELQSANLTQDYCDALKKHKNQNALCLPLLDVAAKLALDRDMQKANSEQSNALHGLPVTIKECFDLSGTPSTSGLVNRKNNIASGNDIYVDALLEAGAVILGKSNVSQLLSFIECDNALYGLTKHPKFAAYSCGGSSGGEGALVGAGLSPLGLGNDIGGSIRVPAAVNGACGIKPTVERFPDQCFIYPEQGQFPIKSAAGPISQDAFTLHCALSAMQKKAETQWQTQPLADYRNVNISSLKIGYFVDDGIFPASQPCQEAVLKAVKKLKNLGANVVEYRYPDLLEAEALFYGSMSIDNGKLLLDCLEGENPAENIRDLCRIAPLPKFVKKIIAGALRLSGQRYESRILNLIGQYRSEDIPRLESEITDYKQKVLKSLSETSIGKLDAVISPLLPVPAYLLNSFKKMSLAGSYCLVNNVTGFPAGVACVGTVSENPSAKGFNRIDAAERQAAKCTEQAEGLPLSVQISAMPWREDQVLALIDVLHQPFTQKIT